MAHQEKVFKINYCTNLITQTQSPGPTREGENHTYIHTSPYIHTYIHTQGRISPNMLQHAYVSSSPMTCRAVLSFHHVDSGTELRVLGLAASVLIQSHLPSPRAVLNNVILQCFSLQMMDEKPRKQCQAPYQELI